jgi:ABC-type amino acid transport substrate-binding protein
MNARRTLLFAAAAWASAHAARALDLDGVRKRGVLRVALYRHCPPFYGEGGQGIDVDIAQALAAALQVTAALLPFDAGENVEDDLRNMVWRGHYLGYGPADVLLHVPVDPAVAERNRRVRILAPYCREKLQVARRVLRVPAFGSLAALAGVPVGVEDATLGSSVLLAAEGGRLRETVRHYRDTMAALDDLRGDRLAAVVGLRSELAAGLAGADGFEITDLRAPGVPPEGWTLGLAVRRDDEALGTALAAAVARLIESGRIEAIFRRHRVDWLRP